ncbi:large ribosomal subunit protein mL62-like [Acropora muricata]|uniref:large ribosomal subunit protein mL62-like n=1 Tax=Acropora muricata TaxID=159855 RepID=UPI0034E6174B
MFRCLKVMGRSCIWSLLVPNCVFLQAKKRTVTILQYHASSIKLRNLEDQDNDASLLNYKGKIPLESFTIKYAKSSGPGGQNVNKVNTKVDLRFHVASAEWLSEHVRQKILQREKNRINKEGELVISSTKYRTQYKNLKDAVNKVEMIIDEASVVPKETSVEKKAHVQKLINKENENRLRAKKLLADKKRDRKGY